MPANRFRSFMFVDVIISIRVKIWASSRENSDIETRDIILSRQRKIKALIRLHGCAGWSAPLLFAYGLNGFSHDVAHLLQFSWFRTGGQADRFGIVTQYTVGKTLSSPLLLQTCISKIIFHKIILFFGMLLILCALTRGKRRRVLQTLTSDLRVASLNFLLSKFSLPTASDRYY